MERRSFLKGFGAAAACAIALPHVASAAEEKKSAGPNEMNYETAVTAITGGKALVGDYRRQSAGRFCQSKDGSS